MTTLSIYSVGAQEYILRSQAFNGASAVGRVCVPAMKLDTPVVTAVNRMQAALAN